MERLDPEVVAQLRELGGDELLFQVARTFLGRAPERLAEARLAVRMDDFPAAAREIHAIRSSAATLGAREIAAQAAELESLAKAAAGDRLRTGLPDLEGRLEELLAALREELPAAR